MATTTLRVRQPLHQPDTIKVIPSQRGEIKTTAGADLFDRLAAIVGPTSVFLNTEDAWQVLVDTPDDDPAITAAVEDCVAKFINEYEAGRS